MERYKDTPERILSKQVPSLSKRAPRLNWASSLNEGPLLKGLFQPYSLFPTHLSHVFVSFPQSTLSQRPQSPLSIPLQFTFLCHILSFISNTLFLVSNPFLFTSPFSLSVVRATTSFVATRPGSSSLRLFAHHIRTFMLELIFNVGST